MRTAGAVRLARGAATAGLATFVALIAHVIAGGVAPGAIGILVPFVLALPVAVALEGRRLPLLRTAAGVVVSQALFHGLFVLGMPRGANAPAMPAGHDHGLALGELALFSAGTAGAGSGTGTAASEAWLTSAGSSGGSAMTLLHLAAAALTIAYLRGADRLVAALGGVLDRWIARLALQVAAPAEAPALPVARAQRTPRVACFGALRSRGPPV